MRVEFLVPQHASRLVRKKGAYSVRPERPLPWLQRLCCWVLERLGAHYMESENFVVEHRVIDGPTFIDRLFQQRAELQRHFNYMPTRLLIGPQEYAQLMAEPGVCHHFSFEAPYHVSDRTGQRRIVNLTVEIVPWMRGLLVMP